MVPLHVQRQLKLPRNSMHFSDNSELQNLQQKILKKMWDYFLSFLSHCALVDKYMLLQKGEKKRRFMLLCLQDLFTLDKYGWTSSKGGQFVDVTDYGLIATTWTVLKLRNMCSLLVETSTVWSFTIVYSVG